MDKQLPIRIAVIDDWQSVAEQAVDWSALHSLGSVTFLHDYPAAPAQMAERLQSYDVICLMRERSRFDKDLLTRLPRLKLLLTSGMRNAAVDMEAAAQSGILVCGTESGKHAAAELTWALIMAVTRNLADEAGSLKTGGWQVSLGGGLYGKTLGILGLGKIGQRVAGYAQAFGMRVIGWSQNLTAEGAQQHGVSYVAKEELFRQSDVLSIHLVLSDRSRGIVDASSMAVMKPTAYLVNTSRGPLVNEAALIKALREHHIAGAALDVYDQEPLPRDHPFRRMDNVLATPHIGYVTQEDYRIFFTQMIEDILAWHEGRPIRTLS
ncbi:MULTISPECIES: D-2-hydroxyacid dehydrogenase family protein [Sodalis]|uniref:Phosphoglycerate dehydrogenase-like enzyme n=1 Tax=Sodalis ligni TaxID=2697027 RepID=A0A4R1NIR9_9GAMM|nr:D-2-hydroxyacid dehydrogenase family protein [Sodalis ligni]TCL04646.1 phosphoglycerate dehydrogenase-like enzyme [Sodalis ligni]